MSLRVTVYTREGCGCCHKALDFLRESQIREGFALEAIDVDSDPALAEQHGLAIPVVLVDGQVRFRGTVNPALWRRLLDAHRGARDRAG